MRIESLAGALPPKSVSTREVLAGCRRPPQLALERLTGIESRHMAGDDLFSIDLAERAARECLSRSRYAADEIDALFCCNISRCDGPDFQFYFEPSTALRLGARLGLGRALLLDISNACAGVFTGLDAARALIETGRIRTALVVSGEYITHLTRTAQHEIEDERDPRVACLTLGDAGVAMVVDAGLGDGEGFRALELFTRGAHSGLCIGRVTESPAGGAIMVTDSGPLHEIAIRQSAILAAEHLDAAGWKRPDVDHFVMHQTARRAIAECARRINDRCGESVLDEENVLVNLRRRGNTATTTHPLAMWDARDWRPMQRGENVLFAVQASGVTVGSALYTLDGLARRMREAPGEEVAAPAAHARKVQELPRVRIAHALRLEDADVEGLRDSAVGMAARAGERCLRAAGSTGEEIGLLLYAGVHRETFLSEPSMASLVQGRLGINAEEDSLRRTLAFDVMNGALGALQALEIASAYIRSGRTLRALVLAAEVDNNRGQPGRASRGWMETGSAILLERAWGGSEEGIVGFGYGAEPAEADAFSSWIGQEAGRSFLAIQRRREVRGAQLRLAVDVARETLRRNGVEAPELGALCVPWSDAETIRALRDRIGVPEERVVVPGEAGLATSQAADALAVARRSGRRGLVLVLSAAMGVQAGALLAKL